MILVLIDNNTDKEVMAMSITENDKDKIKKTLMDNAQNLGITNYEIVEEDREL